MFDDYEKFKKDVYATTKIDLNSYSKKTICADELIRLRQSMVPD